MIVCPSCDKENADTARFCGYCGARMQEEGPSKTLFGISSPTAQPAAAPQRASTPQPASGGAPEAAAPVMEPEEIEVGAPTVPTPAVSARATTEPQAGEAPIPSIDTGVEPRAPRPDPVPDPEPASGSPMRQAAAAREQAAKKPSRETSGDHGGVDKADEEAFFGASLSKYNVEGLSEEDLRGFDEAQVKKGGSGVLIALIVLVVLGAGAAAIFMFVL